MSTVTPMRRPPGLRFVAFDDIVANPQKDWIIKGVLARGETSSWIGGPGQGKSALIADLSFHAASGLDWRGHKNKQKVAVVFHALERGDLLKRRLEAYRLKFAPGNLPIAIVTEPINYMDRNCVGAWVSTLRAIEDRFGLAVGLLSVDTYAKALALGGGDENAAKDQNRVLGHLREVQGVTGAHLALVSHSGKDEGRGARGSNAFLGDVDVMVTITGDRVKEASVTKANDAPEGRLTTFTLESYSFGVDEDGDPITTSIVAQAAPDAELVGTGKSSASPAQRLALDALDEAVGNFGEEPPFSFGLPKGVRVVSFDHWKDELVRRDVLDQDDKNLKQSFYRLRKELAAKKLIGKRDLLVWRTSQG